VIPQPLDYGQARRFSRGAIVALAAGLCSGPVGIGISMFFAANSLNEPVKERLWLMVLVLCHAIPLVLSVHVYFRLMGADGPRGQRLALGGIGATFGWAIIIAAVIFYACR
jgi:hypothetical protein